MRLDQLELRPSQGKLRIDPGKLGIDPGELRLDQGELRIDQGKLRLDQGKQAKAACILETVETGQGSEHLYRFRKGHRLMVQIQSTWFPLYDRNPQRFMPNLFAARPKDFRAQAHRVWHTVRYPSHLSLAVMP